MNRRAFLLGAIATPIATKVDAVSAALRPIAKPIQTIYSDMQAIQQMIEHMMYEVRNTMEYKRAEYDLIVYGQSMFDPAKALAEIAPLDSRREPCDAEFAGRDQIG